MCAEAVQTDLKRKFAEYYTRKQPPLPPDYAQREYGFGFEKKIDYRHKAFGSAREFAEYFAVQAPLYASYSTAVYRYPDARPMEAKEWLGADLAFDFDVPRLPKEHFASPEHNPIVCRKCLDAILKDARQLVEEYLTGDFGFSKQDVTLVYSGSKGYHVHVRAQAVRALGQEARRRLLDYIKGPKDLLERVPDNRKIMLRGPTASSAGWNGKFYSRALAALETVESMRAFGLSKAKAERINNERERSLALLAKGNWDFQPGLEKFWVAVFEETRREHSLEPDAQVTLDLARLIRLPDSLHGSTGFLAATVAKPNFDPLRDAIAFSWRRTERVNAKEAFCFELANETIEVKQGENELPEAAAVLLAGKGKLVN
ncbi:MAG: DNA primase catalytic subunit PriS [Candidatus Micrarchaeia archaeon]